MRRVVLPSAVLVAVLAFGVAPAAADHVRFGVNDDEGLFENGDGPFFGKLTALGMHDDTITIRWDETQASGFEDLGGGVTLQSFLPQTVASADLAGVTLTFDVYPRHSTAAGNPANAPAFAAWLAGLARAYPTVTHYVVMNECNQPLFVSPQYDRKGNLASAAACGAFLAAGYEALKSANPDIFVWGLGLSPHGAKVDGRQHRDASPFDFLSALGAWYRSSEYAGEPIMDGLDLHPYPIPQSVPFARGNSLVGGPSFGVATLPLVYQAFYDAFRDSGQPTVGPGHLPVSLNEVGIQTVPTVEGYTGWETPGWGIAGATGTQAYQAAWYRRLVDVAQCDASITNVNIFKLIDEPDLAGWQSGLYELGWVPKLSADAVRTEIGNVTTCPTGPATTWAPLPQNTVVASIRSQFAGFLARISPSLPRFLGSTCSAAPTRLGGAPNAYLNGILGRLGRATTALSGRLLLRARRRLAAAHPPRPLSFRVAGGRAVAVPPLPAVPPGVYTAELVLSSDTLAGSARIVTTPFLVDARGRTRPERT